MPTKQSFGARYKQAATDAIKKPKNIRYAIYVAVTTLAVLYIHNSNK